MQEETENSQSEEFKITAAGPQLYEDVKSVTIMNRIHIDSEGNITIPAKTD